MRILPLFVALTCACGPATRQTPGDDDAGGGGGGGTDANNSDSGNQTGPSLVYAHTGSALYRVDSTTLSTVYIGPISGIGTQSLTDLAVDKSQNMVGITLDKVFALALPASGSGTVTATPLGSGNLPSAVNGATSLSYIPTSSDPNSDDILVTADDKGMVYEINPTTGSASNLGAYGSAANGGKIISSGDLIGERGLGAGGGVGIYATVNVGSAANDYLASIDPATWKATPLPSDTGFKQIFGLGFWGGTVYGFTSEGQMITIDTATGVGTLVPNGTSSLRWYGAGVTTDAPIIQ